MLIAIDNAVPMPLQRKPAPNIPPNIKGAVERYTAAYKGVYGIPPEIHYRGGFLRIRGLDYGVTVKRLKEMTQQLTYRKG